MDAAGCCKNQRHHASLSSKMQGHSRQGSCPEPALVLASMQIALPGCHLGIRGAAGTGQGMDLELITEV